MSARKKECTSIREKQSLNVRPRENSKTERILLAKNRREKNPQLPAKQGESRDVTFPRHTHVPLSPPKARAKPFSLLCLLLSPVSCLLSPVSCVLSVVTCIQVELQPAKKVRTKKIWIRLELTLIWIRMKIWPKKIRLKIRPKEIRHLLVGFLIVVFILCGFV